MTNEDQITVDVLRAEKRYHIFKALLFIVVAVCASGVIIWDVNQKVNQSHQLLRCLTQTVANAKTPQDFQQSLKGCLDEDAK